MNDKCYSFDEENFSYDSLGELIDNNADEIVVGSIVYVADKHKLKVSRYVDVEALLEQMNEWVYDSYADEGADKWPDLSVSETKVLEEMIANYIEKVSPPNFYGVRNVKSYIITAEDL